MHAALGQVVYEHVFAHDAPDREEGLRLVVVIPCLNEQETVASVVNAVPNDIEDITSVEVVVVDDGSTDETSKRARKAGAHLVRHTANFGLGRTFQDGMDQALALGADIIVNVDGDGQFNAADIPKLIDPLLAGEADFVTASRFKDPALTPQMPAVKRWGNARIAWLISKLTRQTFADVSCGFRAYTREAALNLNLMGKFTYTQETFLDLVFKGFRVVEVPIEVRGVREFGKSRIASSIPKYALRTSAIIFRTFRDYRPLAFFGSIAGICASVSLVLFTFLLSHYLKTGAFSPHVWAGLTGGFFAGSALLVFAMGQSADMMDRQRVTQERILYLLRRNYHTNIDRD